MDQYQDNQQNPVYRAKNQTLGKKYFKVNMVKKWHIISNNVLLRMGREPSEIIHSTYIQLLTYSRRGDQRAQSVYRRMTVLKMKLHHEVS